MESQLTRSRRERVLAGVCGGIAEQTGLDPSLVRIGFVATALLIDPPAAVLVYMVLAFALPDEVAMNGNGYRKGGRVNAGKRSETSDEGKYTGVSAVSSPRDSATGLARLILVAGSVGLVVGKAAFAAAAAALGAVLSAYADPRSDRTSVPTRKTIPVRGAVADRQAGEQSAVEGQAGKVGRSEIEARDAADDPWLSDEERLEFDAKRRIDGELSSARAILERTAPAIRPKHRERSGPKTGGFARKLIGLALTVGGAAMFLQVVQPGTLDGLMSSLPLAAFGALAVVWLGFSVLFSGRRQRTRRRAGERD